MLDIMSAVDLLNGLNDVLIDSSVSLTITNIAGKLMCISFCTEFKDDLLKASTQAVSAYILIRSFAFVNGLDINWLSEAVNSVTTADNRLLNRLGFSNIHTDDIDPKYALAVKCMSKYYKHTEEAEDIRLLVGNLNIIMIADLINAISTYMPRNIVASKVGEIFADMLNEVREEDI